MVIGLSGNLGAGKTTLVKELIRQLGSTESVASPTFVLRRDYQVGDRKFIHIDAYRLESPEQMRQVISANELSDPHNIVFIEWPEKVFPEIFTHVFLLEHVDEVTRKISKM